MTKSNVIIFCLAICCTAVSVAGFQIFNKPAPAEVYYEEAVVDLPEENDNFSELLEIKKKLSQAVEEASLVFVGDIMLSRDVASKISAKRDIDYPFLKTRKFLQSADIVFGNLEAPITPGRKINTDELSFRIDPGMEKALAESNFSVLSLANNHSFNFGEEGLADTFEYLGQAGILYSGAGSDEARAYAPAVIQSGSMKFAFLSYAQPNFVPSSFKAGSGPVVAVMDEERMKQAVSRAKQTADFVIVSMHAGSEYADEPGEEQKQFARAAIDAGADLVIGHHPHVVQTAEEYKDKYIFYSLGNLIFDQMWSAETRQGLVLRAVFNKEGLKKIELLPVLIQDFCQPEILFGSEAQEILERLKIPLPDTLVNLWNAEGGGFIEQKIKVIHGPVAEAVTAAVKTAELDIDGDLIDERFELGKGVLSVQKNGELLWQSPDDWWVHDFVLADSTGDQKININMSVWKQGSFGPSRPFWQEDDSAIGNHFFVYEFFAGRLVPVWQSSRLDAPNCAFDIFDIDGDGQNELIVVEGEYTPDYSCDGEYLAVWKWNGWGFSNNWRSGKGVMDLIIL